MIFSLEQNNNIAEDQGIENECTIYGTNNAVENRLNSIGINIDLNDRIVSQFTSLVNGYEKNHIAMHGFNLHKVLTTFQRHKIPSTNYKLANLRQIDPNKQYVFEALQKGHTLVCGLDGTAKRDYRTGDTWWVDGSSAHVMHLYKATDDYVEFDNTHKLSPIVKCKWEDFAKLCIHAYIFDIVEVTESGTEIVFQDTVTNEIPQHEMEISVDGFKHDYYAIMLKEVPESERLFKDYDELSFLELMNKALLEIGLYRNKLKMLEDLKNFA